MTYELSNALFFYFKTLYDLNRNLILCCGVEENNHDSLLYHEDVLRKIMEDIPKLVPYSAKKGEKEYTLNQGDGLMEFTDELPFCKVLMRKSFRSTINF